MCFCEFNWTSFIILLWCSGLFYKQNVIKAQWLQYAPQLAPVAHYINDICNGEGSFYIILHYFVYFCEDMPHDGP